METGPIGHAALLSYFGIFSGISWLPQPFHGLLRSQVYASKPTVARPDGGAFAPARMALLVPFACRAADSRLSCPLVDASEQGRRASVGDSAPESQTGRSHPFQTQ